MNYVDGWYGGGGRQTTVVPRPRFPFSESTTPDTYTRQYERDWDVYPGGFLPRIGTLNSWTNLVSYSEDIANASWTKTNATATTSAGTAPDGLPSLNKLLETSATGEHAAAHAATVAAAPNEASIFAKVGLTRTAVRLAFTDSAATVFSAFFDVAAGAAYSLSAGVAATVVALGNGHVRLKIAFTPAAGAGTFKVNLVSSGTTISYAGNTAAGAYLWGAQVSLGTGAPYASTTTAARTIAVPDVDDFDPFAFLVGEGDPMPKNSEFETVRRLFSRVPLQQINPGFIRINKPSPPGSLPGAIGSYVVNQPDSAFQAYDAYFRQNTSGDTGPSVPGGGSPTGGSYTISFAGNTTGAIAYNATAGAVQSALNALSSVVARGGVTVTGDYTSGFSIAFNPIPAAQTAVINPAGLIGSYGPFTTIYQLAGMFQVTQLNGNVTGGTFTTTILGQTTAPIAYNASLGTVQAALNALSNVAARGGVVLYPILDPINASNPQGEAILFDIAFEYPAMTVDATGLTPSGSTATVARIDGVWPFTASGYFGRQQTLTFAAGAVTTRTATTPTAHGITTADSIFAKVGDEYFILSPGTFSVPSTTTVQFSAASGAVTSTAGSLSEIGKRTVTGYSPGTINVPCLRTSTYYLPGYTPGISTIADIVPPVYQGDADTMIQLIFSGAGSFNYDVGELAQYAGRIVSLTVTTIRATDLL